MSGPDQGDAATDPGRVAGPASSTAELRADGAHRFDPAGLHYLEVLAARAAAHQGSMQRMLELKLTQAVAVFRQRFDHARADAQQLLEHGMQQYPHATGELQGLFASGDFNGLRRRIAGLKAAAQTASLRELVQRLEQQPTAGASASSVNDAGPRAELKTIRNFRNTWARLSVDKKVARALRQAPKNAGPINSHMLVLRSLALMRDVSPDYLNRFISYADTLLCLDQGEKEKTAGAKKQAGTKAAKK